MDREELSALVGAVQEIAAAVKRIEDRQDHMEGLLAKLVDRQDHTEGLLVKIVDRLEHIEADFQEFRKESREQKRRLDHHDRMLMEHDRRIEAVEETQAP